VLLAGVCGAQSCVAQAPTKPATAPFEIVKSRTDIDVNADGSYVEATEAALRVLDSRGLKALQQTTLAYTEGLQSLEIGSAYTQKANGEKIEVPRDQILRGYGATSKPGFEDVKTLTIVYPKLEIGDEVVLITLMKQRQPLFAGAFAERHEFSRAVGAHDVELTLTAPQDRFPLRVEATGLEGGQRENFAGKYRWVWQYRNDSPVADALGSVMAADNRPHVNVSSFSGYEAVGRAYGEHFAGKADVSPDIRALADRLTTGLTDHRTEAKALYDWVSTNISYVNIVLGAGGFTPHAADDVLRVRYGDCKDHVMLLEALLAAKGIASQPALIAAGGAYILPDVPSPFYFNHVITYVPEWRLFLDSTAHYAPFEILPVEDQDRPVLLIPGGEISATPNAMTSERAEVTVKFAADGTAEGQSRLSATSGGGIIERAMIDAIPPEREKDFFQFGLGAGSETTIDRGNLQSLSDPFTFAVHYRVPNAANFPGPGAIASSTAFGPFAAGGFIVGALPPSRDTAYLCPSMDVREDNTFELPPGVVVTSVPKPASILFEGTDFEMRYTLKDTHTVVGNATLRATHPRAFCTPEYYNRVRGELARIAASLRGQILYK
jgi:transglutaminase-like putative cysteine protease